ncbi:serine/threonine-protein phosphatase 4 regulatory subunit 2-like [Thalassophryne amazonica]|uniref:serine/threonine-protein phosphatase 4 regulatory subunit 2-like n=1 Tax=Thalassophryne amazonica TaxID=390379 RepID=UPI001471BF7B|nr:serine/threonine-protein phosphatase 4 regulatory subunit 2-like [Thalassophryne amazonica]
MVVSCVYPTLEKNVATSVKGMNGMFPGNSSLYSGSETVNGSGTPEPLGRPKLLLSASLSANGLPDCTARENPLQTTEELAKHCISDSSLSQGESNLSIGLKNKHGNEDSEVDKHEVKRLKSDKDGGEMESEEKELSSFKWVERLAIPEHLKDSCESSSMLTDTSEGMTALRLKNDSTEDRPDQPAQPETSTDFEQDSTNTETSHKRVQSSK